MITRSMLNAWENNPADLSRNELIEIAGYFEGCINHFNEHQKIIEDI